MSGVNLTLEQNHNTKSYNGKVIYAIFRMSQCLDKKANLYHVHFMQLLTKIEST